MSLFNLPFWALSLTGSLVFLGLIFLVVPIIKSRKKNKAIKHYEQIRDKLTVRERKEVEEEIENDYGSSFSLANLIGGFVVIFIGFNLAPVVSKEIQSISNATTTSHFSASFFLTVPILIYVGVILFALSMVYSFLRHVGLI